MQIFTSIAANYLPKARVLARSVKTHHPEARFVLVLTDDKPQRVDWANEPYDVVLTVADLDIPNWKGWLFGMRLVEACTAVKPFALKKLLHETGDTVVYLDPDIAVFHPITPVVEALKTSSILLTPHITVPENTPAAIIDNEICTLRHGLYNLGFVAVAPDRNGLAYADWWAERCYTWCRDDIPFGLFTDQRWNDFVPIFFDGVKIMKNPGLNVATWNYTHRMITGDETNGFRVNDELLYFHHFTGYDSGAHKNMLARYGKDMPAAVALSQWYEDALSKTDYDQISKTPWKYATFENGAPITEQQRNVYRNRPDVQQVFPDPYACHPSKETPSLYYTWLLNYFFVEQKKDAPLVSAILVTHNSENVIGEALLSLMKFANLAECFVVDNASRDNTVGYIKQEFPQVRIISNDRNLGFGHACNQALKEISTDYVLFMNPDARLHEDTLPRLLGAAKRYPEAGILSPQLVNEAGQHYFNFRRNIFVAEKHYSPLSHADGDICTDFITGALWLVNTQKFRAIGGFDPNFFLYCEDDDVCLRMQEHKHPIMVIADAYATHFGGKSSRKTIRGELFKGKQLAFSRLRLQTKYHQGRIGKKLFVSMVWDSSLDVLRALKRLHLSGSIQNVGRVLGLLEFWITRGKVGS